MIQGKGCIEQALDAALLLIDMLAIDIFVLKWKESNKHTDDIKSLLKFSECRISRIIEENISSLSVKQICEKVQQSICSEYESNPNCKYYAKINKIFEEIILFMMKDSNRISKEKVKDQVLGTGHSQLKQMLIDTINKCYNYQNSVEEQLGLLMNSGPRCKIVDLENLGASFLFPLLNYLIDSNLLRLDVVSVEPWINRTTETSWFYSEVGVGGTITHLMKEYFSKVKGNQLLNMKPCDFNGELHHRIMKLSYIVLKELGRNYIDLRQKSESLTVDLNFIKDSGNEFLYNILRPLYGVYSIRNQGMIYAYSFFILKFVHHLKETQKEVLYFMPKFVLEIPIYAFTTLTTLNSPYLNYGSWFELQIRGKNELFKANEYVSLLLSFYNDILMDEKINNPEIVEIVIKAINTFVMNSFAVQTYISDKKLLTDFLMAQVKYLSSESLSNLVFTNIFELIKPACLKFDLSQTVKFLIKNSVATCFESNSEFYKKFLDDYSNLLNKNLTRYCIYLEELVKENIKILNFSNQTQYIKTYFVQWHNSLVYLYEALMIYEVIIYASPDILDVESLGFSMLMQIVGTISTRIICLPYIKSAIGFSTNYKSETINELYLAIMGLFCQLKEKLDLSQAAQKEKFIKKVATTGIDFKVFLDIAAIDIPDKFKAHIPETLKNYCTIIEELMKISLEYSSDSKNVSASKLTQTIILDNRRREALPLMLYK